jgi:hypothetical protein
MNSSLKGVRYAMVAKEENPPLKIIRDELSASQDTLNSTLCMYETKHLDNGLV